jgi:uncharacterized protein YdhG (YjbR/CyaY superfamily)
MSAKSTNTGSFTDVEREAMRNRAKELAAEAKSNKTRAEGEKEVQDAITAMDEPDRSMATRINQIVTETAPELFPKTWYGMPAYADKEGKVICFFQAASKFKARYATFGFSDTAKLDTGNMWPAAFALTKLAAAEEAEIARLVKKAVG